LISLYSEFTETGAATGGEIAYGYSPP